MTDNKRPQSKQQANTDMLDELNGLIDQNSRLVKEVDDLRLKLAHAEDGTQSAQ